MPIGVDEWVAQQAERADAGGGWRGTVARLSARVGWWPRLSLAVLAGLIFGQLSLNVNVQTVAVNCLIYAILAVGLNIAVGWTGLLDLGYVAFYATGAYTAAWFASLQFSHVTWRCLPRSA